MLQFSPLHNILKPLALSLVLFAASAPVSAVTVANDGTVQPSETAFVILVRHGDAPGRGEPEDFELGDCNTQRNLSDQGRSDALALGHALRLRQINVSKILASRWCRARQTAELIGLGPVDESPAFDNMDFNRHRSVDLIQRERQLIASWRGPGVLLIVTHSSNIKALTGHQVGSGIMVVANPTTDTNTVLHFGKMALTDPNDPTGVGQ